MNGYELEIQACQKYLETHPEADPTMKEYMERKIMCTQVLKDKTRPDINALYDSGAFNEISRGYFQKAMKNCQLDKKTIDAVLSEYKYLLDTICAEEART